MTAATSYDFLGIPRKTQVRAARLFITALVFAVGVLTIVPFIWTISTSFKREVDVFSFPIQWIPPVFTTLPYERVLGVGSLISASRSVPFWKAYLNSITVTLPGVIGPLITSTLAGYAFARLRFPGKQAVFLLYLGTMIIPEQVLMVPRFMIANWLGIYNTHWALILPYMITAYGVFLIRQACLTIPQDLFDAAQIDGAGHLQPRLDRRRALHRAAALGALADPFHLALERLQHAAGHDQPLREIHRAVDAGRVHRDAFGGQLPGDHGGDRAGDDPADDPVRLHQQVFRAERGVVRREGIAPKTERGRRG